MQKKQAIMFLVHNNIKYFEKLLILLDSDFFDIFIHVDKSANLSEFHQIIKKLTKSRVFFVSDRIDIRWGDFSIVEAELLLLKLAQSNGPYSYYHLLSGADFIIKKPRQIFEFFANSENVEYINFFDVPIEKEEFYQRRYKFRYKRKYPKKKSVWNKAIYQIYLKYCQYIQKGQQRKKMGINFYVGSQWFSITDNCVSYILSQISLIRELFVETLVPDESFIQTLICMNEELRSNIVSDPINYSSIKRDIQFIDGKPKVWTIADYEELMFSTSFFARKFDQPISDKIIETLIKELQEE
ncbi:hypothetical protein HO831_04695 [Streptococcus suis]|uniref:Peptide O-xylosyltransferase n=2 Tax=Streptococcus suis TaxID=1307 RepID=G8DTR7_STRSU|nr:beta-1,6-N-acetylglucosaminyltransferase [Streptococcus suis]AEH57418.1 Cps4I [Streptococcus suis]AIG43798.1 hypothetical protein ID09_07070 [Streptococcus suis 6407]AXI66213.1 hypothetical protein DP111_09450 [Streptococcus suis]MBO8060261.1 hypothetical protein [Streptococcus suis]MBS8067441.1 hypothetical protein [Streptococcus suis]